MNTPGLFQKAPTEKNYEVVKAFLVKGGTLEQNEAKVNELRKGERFLAIMTFYGPNDEIIILFSGPKAGDLCNMTFEEARKFVGERMLSGDFMTSMFDPKEPMNGIINIGPAMGAISSYSSNRR